MTSSAKEAESIKRMAEKLQGYECISKFDSNDEPEAWRLAHSLHDLEGSFSAVLNKHLPGLRGACSEQEINDALLDMGEEFRHIIYHLKDPRFFSYLFDE